MRRHVRPYGTIPSLHANAGLRFFLVCAALASCMPTASSQPHVVVHHAPVPVRQTIDFDDGWRFLQSDAKDAQAPGFDDHDWIQLDVPHDWSIKGPVALTNPSGQGGGFFPEGVGWYRKRFSLPEADAHRRIYVVFDGVMSNSDVWINGYHLSRRPYGYVSFIDDLTGHVNIGDGARNVLAVRCDNAQQPASRWYEGGGIYRHVRLVVTDAVHLEPWSTFVRTPQVSNEAATIHVTSTAVNDTDKPVEVSLRVAVQLPDGNAFHPAQPIVSAPVTVAARSKADLGVEFQLPHPERWDIDHPALHLIRVSLEQGSRTRDDERLRLGIREFHFDAETGFWMNGRNFKIKGAALHIDGGAVGTAVPLAVYERRLLALRALGVNAIRTAHNPPSPQFLDLCDRLGFLVMEEMFDCWTVGKNPYDYHLYFRDWAHRDLEDTVRRDRNHPSIILWSAGNEIHDTPHPAVAKPILASLVADFHANDPTRPVTQALFRPNASHDYEDGLADMLDVVGQNYRENELLAAHAQKPTRKIIGTETTLVRSAWLAMRDNPAFSGQFLWVGIDYLGESGQWPLIANGSGLLDHTAAPKAAGLEREAWWSSTPNIHIARRISPDDKTAIDPGYESVPPKFHQALYLDWTPASLAPHTEDVEVYTNAEEAELLLNGRSLGRQKLHADASPLTWEVPFSPGDLVAVAYNGGREVARDVLRTAGEAVSLRLTPEHASFAAAPDDVLYLHAEAVDAHGVIVPGAANRVYFGVEGDAAQPHIRAVDSGSNADDDSFQADSRRLFQGRAIILIDAGHAGTVRIQATSPGLKPATAVVTATPAPANTSIRSF